MKSIERAAAIVKGIGLVEGFTSSRRISDFIGMSRAMGQPERVHAGRGSCTGQGEEPLQDLVTVFRQYQREIAPT